MIRIELVALLLSILSPLLLAASGTCQDSVSTSQTTPTSSVAGTAWQLKNAARAAYERANPDEAKEHLQSLLDLYRTQTAGDRSDRGPYRWSRRLAEVAREYLRAGELISAMVLFGEAADLNVPLRNEYDNGFAAVAGGLHRSLVKLDAAERYELLHDWTMPTESRRTVRIVTSIVPNTSPPSVFARALGERSRETSFPVSSVGEVRGLFSTAWTLVQAAADTGRLGRLIIELGELSKQQVPGADPALTLARIVDADGPDEKLVQRLVALRLVELRQEQPTQEEANILSNAVLAAACLQRQWLQPLGEGILEELIENTNGSESSLIRPFLRLAHAVAIRQQIIEASSDLISNPRLQHWVAASGYDAKQNARGAPRPLWLAHEDHILHVTGPRNDTLFFRYPLIGDFEFSCETQDGGRGDNAGGLMYGGLGYEARGAGQSFKVWDADFRNEIFQYCPFVRVEPGRQAFNRMSLKRTAEGVTFASNGHPVWSDISKDQSSPWIGLRSFNDRRPLSRNFKITGSPVVPREVRMIDGDRLPGWLSGYYGHTTPTPLPDQNRRSTNETPPAAEDDWFAADGVLQAAKRTETVGSSAQSRLSYVRPLLDDESVTYEFQYSPGRFEVHPALGRLAFLIEPSGVRLHWMTDGDDEWSGLTEDNSVAEPFNRRGPRPLPLNADSWNRVSLVLADGIVTLSLNGTTIYVRAIEAGIERKFGFYHQRHRSAVRVRNVVMRGNWPLRLTQRLLDNLLDKTDDVHTRADTIVLSKLFQEDYLAENSLAVQQRANSLPIGERYDYLSDWVLPSKNSPTIRLVGDFTTTNPAPDAGHNDTTEPAGIDPAVADPPARVQTGAGLIAPAFDLIEAAKDLGRLDDLRQKVDQIAITDQQQRKARLAMIVLINIALDDEEAAAREFEQLFAVADATQQDALPARWPETLAIWQGIRYPATRKIATELIQNFYARVSVRYAFEHTTETWANHICSLAGMAAHLARNQSTIDQFTSAPTLKNWLPASYARARSRGEGRPGAHWQSTGSRIDKLSGHHHDYMFYRIPLRGNYQVECEAVPFGRNESHLMVAGTFVAPMSSLRKYKSGNFRVGRPIVNFEPPLSKTKDWIRYRVDVRDGVATTHVNGRPLHQEQLPAEHEPWLAIRSFSRHHSAVRDLRITGQPVVPEQVNLTTLPDLPGWVSYYDQTVATPDGQWQHLDDLEHGGGIVGQRDPRATGSLLERLLRYNRPMFEDGTIEYEFYYRAGEVLAHPALDRLAFMLEPAGVQIHWITDGRWERSGLAAANMVVEPENRRGPQLLPLKPDAWNQLRVTLTGDVVALSLNGQRVYERELEPTNQRTFGIFHYASRSEARIRNVVWRGDWPREVPEVASQEIAGEMADFLDKRIPELTAVFEHDFTSGGLPDKYFRKFGAGAEKHFSIGTDGVHATREGLGKWAQAALTLRFGVRGDFDITASFDQFDSRNPTSCSALLLAILEGETTYHCRTHRGHNSNGQHSINGQLIELPTGGGRRTRASQQTCEAVSGRLRLARRGDMTYFLFAEADSEVFRIIGTEKATTDDVQADGVRLIVSSGEGAKTSVIWKNFSLRAEQLMLLPEKPKPAVLFVMRSDGKELRQLTETIGELGGHSSPAWSADGKQVAFDTYNGTTATAHIYVVNSDVTNLDGTGLKDLGIGSMPTFSRDGKRIAFSWSGRGIAVMNADGTGREILDRDGWGAQWSPDGKSIAYGSSNITILDLATRRKRTILQGEHAARYGFIYWNMAWSLDSRRVCFKARTRTGGKFEIAIADVAGSSQGFKLLYASETEFPADFSWHPTGKEILFAMNAPQFAGPRLFTLNVQNTGQPQLLPTQPLDHRNVNANWTRDGKYIVFSGQPPPKWEFKRGE